MYHGKFDPKREVCTLKGTMTLTDYKSLFIYTHLYLQALIQVPSVTIQYNPGSFRWIPVPFHWNPVDSCGIWWNPAEWMHSCRNLWGIKKYRSWPPLVLLDEGWSGMDEGMISSGWRCLTEGGGVREQTAVVITYWDDKVPWVGEDVGQFRIWMGRRGVVGWASVAFFGR